MIGMSSATPSDEALAALRSARTLTELVGPDAAGYIRTRSWLALGGIAVSMLIGVPLTLVAHHAEGAAGQAATVGVVVAYGVAGVLFGLSLRAGSRAGRAASAYLGPRLGHPVRRAAFNTVDSWRTHLLREHSDAVAGRKRPFFSIHINRPLSAATAPRHGDAGRGDPSSQRDAPDPRS